MIGYSFGGYVENIVLLVLSFFSFVLVAYILVVPLKDNTNTPFKLQPIKAKGKL